MIRKVGFVGLGAMGTPMANVLIAAGFELYIYDPHSASCAALVEKGAQQCSSCAEVAQSSEVVVTMLPGAPQLKEVYLGADGLLAGSSAGLILIDSSTAEPSVIKEISEAATRKQVKVIDAPVGGGVPKAESGSLIMLASGELSAIQQAAPVLDAVGSRTIHVGPVGTGKALKLINNLITGMQCCLLAESLTLAEKSGVEFETLMSLLKDNLMWVVETIAGKMHNEDYTPGFKTSLMHKDLKLVLQMADDSETNIPFTSKALDTFGKAKDNGWEDLDFTCIKQLLES